MMLASRVSDPTLHVRICRWCCTGLYYTDAPTNLFQFINQQLNFVELTLYQPFIFGGVLVVPGLGTALLSAPVGCRLCSFCSQPC
jgi:hypothetical protein